MLHFPVSLEQRVVGKEDVDVQDTNGLQLEVYQELRNEIFVHLCSSIDVMPVAHRTNFSLQQVVNPHSR